MADGDGRIGGWRGTVPALFFVAVATRVLASIGLAVIPRDGTTLVRLALAVADRGYILESGHIVHEGPASEIREDPALERAYLGEFG